MTSSIAVDDVAEAEPKRSDLLVVVARIPVLLKSSKILLAVDPAAHESPPLLFVVSTWFVEPSALGKRYSTPFKVVEPVTASVAEDKAPENVPLVPVSPPESVPPARRR